MIRLGGEDLDAADAEQLLLKYASHHEQTVRVYDYGGVGRLVPASDGVELGDIGRLVVINAGMAADDVPRLLEPVDARLWEAVPHDLTFLELEGGPALITDPRYLALGALYAEYRSRPGLGRTKVSKLLHLKRPHLVPILDSVAEWAYRDSATELGKQLGSSTPTYWAAMWKDARENQPLLDDVRPRLRTAGDAAALVAGLPLLRLMDILIWSHFYAAAKQAKAV